MTDLTKNIIQIVLFAILVLFATLYFTESCKNKEIRVMNDSLINMQIQKAKIEEQVKNYELKYLELKDELDILKSQEVKIINNNTTFKNNYQTLKPNETDSVYLNLMKGK